MIHITLKAGHHWPTNDCWLSRFVIYRGSGPVLLKPLYFCDFPGGPYPLSSPLDPCMNTHNGNEMLHHTL